MNIDKSLIRKVKNHDNDSIEVLIREILPELNRVARCYVANNEDAQDVSQNAVLKIIQSIDTLQDESKFSSWCNRIVRNEALNLINKNYNQKEVHFTDLGNEEDGLEYDPEDEKTSSIPELQMDNQAKQDLIFEILNGLTESQRVVTLMYFYDQMTMKDIASELQVPVSTVIGRLQKAKKNIKTEVLALEKRDGIKLYGVAPLPFFIQLLRMWKETNVIRIVAGTSIGGAAGTATAAKAVGGASATTASSTAATGVAVTTSSASAASAAIGAKAAISAGIVLASIGGGVIAGNVSANNQPPTSVREICEYSNGSYVYTTEEADWRFLVDDDYLSFCVVGSVETDMEVDYKLFDSKQMYTLPYFVIGRDSVENVVPGMLYTDGLVNRDRIPCFARVVINGETWYLMGFDKSIVVDVDGNSSELGFLEKLPKDFEKEYWISFGEESNSVFIPYEGEFGIGTSTKDKSEFDNK